MSALQWIADQSWVIALGWTLVHSLWEGLTIAFALAIALRAMRSRSAGARYVVSIGALALIVVCAVATFGVLNGLLNRQAMSMPVHSDSAAPAIVRAANPSLAISRPVAPIVQSETASWDQRLEPALPWIVLFWSCGVLVMGIYQAGGWIVVLRVRRSGEPLTDPAAGAIFRELLDRLSISRPVRLARSALVQVPSVIGALRPMVLLPTQTLTGLTPDQLRGLLAHELAHIRRHDYLVNAIQTIVETLLFYHPAVWWMGRVIRQERENACDDLAAEVCDRKTYAQALAAMEKLRHLPAVALGADGGSLVSRIRRILLHESALEYRPARPTIATASFVIVLAAVVLIAGACHTSPHRATMPSAAATPRDNDGFLLPTEEDLKPYAGEDRIVADDLLSVKWTEANAVSETVKQVRVGEDGTISLPLIGHIQAAGKAANELKNFIAQRFADAAISVPKDISVAVIESRFRTFSILGNVKQPGQYALVKNDFRLRDALQLAGQFSAPPETLRLYVLRQPPNAFRDQRQAMAISISALEAGDAKYNIAIRPGDLIIASQMAISSTQPTESDRYYITGVPRTGVYSLSGRKITLLQALIAAGADPDLGESNDVIIRRRSPNHPDDKPEVAHFTMAEILHGDDGPFLVAADDVITVKNAAHQSAASFVRLVVGSDQLTLEGKYVTFDTLKAELEKISGRGSTVLEIAVASDDVTVGRLNRAMAIAAPLGFQYLSQIGVHSLESKAGDERPTTRPATQPAADGGVHQYYIGGHVSHAGMYSIAPNQKVHLTQAVAAAGGIDDPNHKADAYVIMRRRHESPDGSRWGDLVIKHVTVTEQSAHDSVLRPNDEVIIDYWPNADAKPDGKGERSGSIYIGGNIYRSGMYEMWKDRDMHLTDAIIRAGEFDDPKSGGDTDILLRRKSPQSGDRVVSHFTWGQIHQAGADPILQADDVIELGVKP